MQQLFCEKTGVTRRIFRLLFQCLPSCQNATALAAATFRESTPWDMGIFTV